MHALYLLAAALLAGPSLAHTAMCKPPPIRYKTNPNVDPSRVDYSYSAPLLPDGSNFPCKGYHKDAAGAEGNSVATWPAGTVQSIGIGDGSGAIHRGGSCQFSLSEDAGASFKVIKSFIGACPTTTQQIMEVEIPKEAKSGTSIFAWTWFNKAGQREMYMNCAVVTITDGGGGLAAGEWPDIFKANIGGTCTIDEGIDIVFPNPGKNTVTAQGNVNLGPPTGECGPSGPAGPGPIVPSASSAEVPGSSPAATSSVAAPPSPISSASPTVPAAATPGGAGEPAACSCVCGGPDGYVVNIVPVAAGISEGVMPRAPRTLPPESGAAADGGEGSLENRSKTCGWQRRDHLRRHGVEGRRGGGDACG